MTPTTLAEHAPEIDDGRTWVRRSGPAGTLESEWLRRYSEHAVRCFRDTGFFVVRFDAATMHDGWFYVRLPDEAHEEAEARLAAHRARTLTFHERGTSHWVAEVEPQTRANITRMRRARPRSEALPSLSRHIDVCLDASTHTSGYLHWAMAAGFHGGWPETFAELTGRPPIESSMLLRGLDHASRRLLRDLRRAARAQQAGEGFDAEMARLIRRWGRRSGRGYGSDHSFSMPTWSIDRSLALTAVDAHARSDIDAAERRDRANQASRRRALRHHRAALAADPERLARFDRAHEIAVWNTKAMEDHNALMEQETEGLLREAIHRAGLALASAGVVAEPDDVYHLTVEEIADPPAGAAALIDRRKAALQRAEAHPPPEHVGPPPPPPPARDPLGMVAEPTSATTDPGVLVGVGGSPGRVTGRAVVAADVQALPEVEPGDILVARDAGPAWTPIFAVLGGIALDEGAVNQHAAIVARELGIPAVLGTKTATTTIASGSTVTVDGTEGLVALDR